MTDTPVLRKGRGAFFTPPELSRFLIDWAVRGARDRVLEPSCGEASFLLPAADRLERLGARADARRAQLAGVELHAPSAQRAGEELAGRGHQAAIRVADFFDVEPDERYDAVVGNPPYVRYQSFSGASRAKALQAAETQGVRLTRLASSWAAFVVHAARFLEPGGRLGLVLPAELLTVNYAAPVRRFLLERFERVRLVMFEELVFPGVLEEVVLLLAEGERVDTEQPSAFEVYQSRDLTDLPQLDDGGRWPGFRPEADGKWTPALLTAGAFSIYSELVAGEPFEELLQWGETSLGSVTGNNGYFALSAEEARRWRIRDAELLTISPPGSKHLKGLTFTEGAWTELEQAGSACYLFAPSNRPSAGARNYIEHGEELGVHHAYKCRVRSPWWRVPLLDVPDLLFTYMNQDRPRLLTNACGVLHLNSIYGVYLRRGRLKHGRSLLPVASLNSVSLLGSEMVGRAYGGGMLKLEPREADCLPVPSLALVADAADELRALRGPVTRDLREGELLRAIDRVDRVLLHDRLRLPRKDLQALRDAREVLFSRRTARGRTPRLRG